MKQASGARSTLGYIAIMAVGAVLAFMVQMKSQKDTAIAIEHYKQESSKQAEEDAKKIAETLTQIYQGIRTISFLPSVKSIDRYGKSLDANAHESIIQIYNNLRSNVAVSEVYIVPESLEPEQIDTETGSFQTPILMFDDSVANHEQKAETEEKKITTIAEAEAAEEVEIYEYRVLKEQMGYLRQNYPDTSKIDKLNLPFVGSKGVLTCDNDEYKTSKNDADRTGNVLSVPFYGDDGKFKGTVTAVVRNNVLRELLPPKHYALINSEYNYLVTSKDGGEQEISKDWVLQKQPDPSLIFSTVIEIKTPDPRSKWVLWGGYPDEMYHESGDAKAIANFRLAGFGFAGLLTLLGIGVYAMIQRNFRVMERNNAELERKVSERAAEIERLAR